MKNYVILKDSQSSNLHKWNLSLIDNVFSNIKATKEYMKKNIFIYKSIGYKITETHRDENSVSIVLTKKDYSIMFRIFKLEVFKYWDNIPY